MKDKKTKGIGVRLNETQEKILQSIIEKGLAKSNSGAIQYLINSHAIKEA
ncbi:hypothetical protein [Pantoea agglomerans]|jgi:Arc/MetJ-type ribon-helix-helix transcriptional regulator|nr:hypothetical protein [Pantoea agglomerans]MDF9910167.1 Arc/MetJ-type ribon-helix-helix transcriptional regulator [Pantoea brenneri]